MANNKFFVAKNGILTPVRGVFGSSTDNGTDALQITGSSLLTGAAEITGLVTLTDTTTSTTTGGAQAVTISGGLDVQGSIHFNPASNSFLFNSDTNTRTTFDFRQAGSQKWVLSFEDDADLNWVSVGNYELQIDGSRILTTADEGSGNGLDADTIDGLDSTQFLRSDVSDTMDGSLIITGDLTVQGTTTYIDTETILLSDNIITLNANYTGSAPTEDAGIEVERGTLTNSSLIWDESEDYWKLISGGTDLGRIITVQDQASQGGSFDAATLDGLDSLQFLRSDADDTTTGTLTVEGTLNVGNESGVAYVSMNGNGVNRIMAGSNGVIGFMDTGLTYVQYSDANGNWIVDGGSVIAADDLTATAGDITAVAGNIEATAGSVTAGTTVTAGTDVIGQRFVDADDNNYYMDPLSGGKVAGTWDWTNGSIQNLNNLSFNDPGPQEGIRWKAGNEWKIYESPNDLVTNSAGNLQFTSGAGAGTMRFRIESDGDVVVSKDAYAVRFIDTDDNAFLVDPSGTSELNILNLSGTLTGVDATFTGQVSANTIVSTTTVTAGTDVVGQRFVDADNINYYVDPAGSSVMNDIGIDDYITHNGDAGTYFGFDANDSIVFFTNSAERIDINNIFTEVKNQMRSSTYYDSKDLTFFGDFSTVSRINEINLVSKITNDSETNTYINFSASDTFNVFTSAAKRFEVTNTYALAVNDMRAPVFTSSIDTTYFYTPNEGAGHRFDTPSGFVRIGPQNTSYSHFNTDRPAYYFDKPVEFDGSISGYDGTETATFDIFYDASDINFYGDFAGTSLMRRANFYSGEVTGEINVGRNANERINLYVEDELGYFRYYQDESGTENHSFYFQILSSSTGANQFYFNKSIDVTGDITNSGNIITAGDVQGNTVTAIEAMYSPVYYDSDDNLYFGDFNSRSFLSSLVVGQNSAGTYATDSILDVNGPLVMRSSNIMYFGVTTNTVTSWTTRQYASGSSHLSSAQTFQWDNIGYGGSTGTWRMQLQVSAGVLQVREDVQAKRFVDISDNNYYYGPSTGSYQKNWLSFGIPGNGTNTDGRFLSIEGNTDAAGEGSSRIFFTEHNSTTAQMSNYGMSLGYRGGGTSIVGADGNTWTGLSQINNGEWGIWGHDGGAAGALAMYGPRSGAYVAATGSFRAPVFYDLDDVNFYLNPANASRLRQIDIIALGTSHEQSLNLYSFDQSNYWSLITDNSANDQLRIYKNGVEKFRFETDHTLSLSDMRAPRFVDSDDTDYYADLSNTAVSITAKADIRVGVIADSDRQLDTVSLNPTGGIAASIAGNPHVGISGPNGGNALLYLNRIGTPGFNPDAADNTFIDFRRDANQVATIAVGPDINTGGDDNLYLLLQNATGQAAGGNNFQIWDSALNPLMMVQSDGNIIIGNYLVTHTVSDNTALVGTIANNRMHLETGSIQLNDANGAIVFGTGTSTFLKDEELGFGWGSGWYMTDATYLRVRNNTSVYSGGDAYFNRYYDVNATTRWIEPGGGGRLEGNFEFAALDTGTSYTEAAIELRESNYTGNNTATPPRISFHWGGVVASQIAVESDGTIAIRNNPGTGYEKFRASQVTASIFYDAEDTGFYTNPAATSLMRRANFYSGEANGEINVGRGSTQRINLYVDDNTGYLRYYQDETGTNDHSFYFQIQSSSSGANQFYFNRPVVITGSATASIYYDADDSNYYGDFAGTSQMNRIDIDDYIRHRGDLDTYMGFGGADQWRVVAGNQLQILTTSTYTQIYDETRSPIYKDSDNLNYFGNFAGESRMDTIKLADNEVVLDEPTGSFGSLQITGGATGGYEGYSIAGRAVFMNDASGVTGIYDDVNNKWFLYGESNSTLRLMYSGVEEASTQSGYFLANNEIRSPIFRDTTTPTTRYVDPAGTSQINVLRTNRIYPAYDNNTGIYIDYPTGDYGSIQVNGGGKNGWEGYSINGRYVFMSADSDESGIYNDLDNEWMTIWRRGGSTELYYNGGIQAETENGYFTANNEMRAPIYYGTNNTSAYYYPNRTGNTETQLSMTGQIVRSNFNTTGGGDDNKFLVAQDYSSWVWNTATNWGIFWAGNDNPSYSYFGTTNPNEMVFVGSGNVRASIDLDTGDAFFGGEVYADNFNLVGPAANISLNPAYGSGGADLVLFDFTTYSEAEMDAPVQSGEVLNVNASSYIEVQDSPFAGKTIRVTDYRQFYSDYIPVAPGEVIYGEISERLVNTTGGTGGRTYYGVERYDKDKRPIAGNGGTTYFVRGGQIATNTGWETRRAHTTIPTSHTPYNGSDGGGVHYVRIRILMNYPGGTGYATRDYGGIMLKRRNAESNLLVDDLTANDITADDITADVIDANIFRDRDTTAYFVDPGNTLAANLAGTIRINGTSTSSNLWLDMDSPNNGQGRIRMFNWQGDPVIEFSDGSNNTNAQDQVWALGADDREAGSFVIRWGGGALFPSNWSSHGTEFFQLKANGNLSLSAGEPDSYRLHVGGVAYASTAMRSPIFYDHNDDDFYGNFAGTSVVNVIDSNRLLASDYVQFGGATINGQSHYQWDGATYRNPSQHTPRALIRLDNSTVGLDGSRPALTLYNNIGSDQATISQVFASREANGSGNAVNLAGIIAKKEGAGNANAWSRGSLTLFVKNFNTRVDALSLNYNGITTPLNFTTSGNMYASVYFDGDDVNWYMDPDKTSRINKLRVVGKSPYNSSATGGGGRIYIGDEVGVDSDVLREGRRPDLTLRGQYPQINLIGSRISNTTHGPTLRFMGYDSANASSGNHKHWVIGTSSTDSTMLSFGYSPNRDNPHYGIGRGWSSGNNVAVFWMQNNRHVYAENTMYAARFTDRESTSYFVEPGDFSNLNSLGFNGGLSWRATATASRGNMLLSTRAVSGRKLYSDEDFEFGYNSTQIYNNAGGSALTRSIITLSDAPNQSRRVVRYVRNGGSNGTSPGNGGFYHATGTNYNRILTARFKARLKAGAQFNWASNSIGSGGNGTWISSQAGTGKWEEYVFRVISGTSGWSSTHFFYVTGSFSNGEILFDLASSTVIDESDNMTHEAARYIANGSGGYIQAPIFYDTDSTYRMDMNSVSSIRYLDMNTGGSSSRTRAMIIKQAGLGVINFGQYPAAWTSALQIQNNNNSDMIWISPLQDGYNGRFRMAGAGLDFYTGGTVNSTGTLAATIDDTRTTFANDVYAQRFVDSNSPGFYLNPASTSNVNSVMFDLLRGPSTSSYDKIRVYDSSAYAIGMVSGHQHGWLSDWAMTFRFNNDNDRGFWWGDTAHSTSSGAMSLTTNGRLVVSSNIRVGYGESDVNMPSIIRTLDVNGDIAVSGDSIAARFVDANDSNYYVDPNSASNLATLNVGFPSPPIPSVPRVRMTVTGGHGTTQSRLLLPYNFNGAGTGNVTLQSWVSEPGLTWDWAGFGYNVSNGLNAGAGAYLGKPNPALGQAFMRFTPEGETRFYNTTRAGSVKYLMLLSANAESVTVNGTLNVGTRVNAPLYYSESGNSYYLDPDGTSQLRTVIANNWFYASGNTGFGFSSYGNKGLVSAETAGNLYGHVATSGAGRNGWHGYGLASWDTYMAQGTYTGHYDNVNYNGQNTRGWISFFYRPNQSTYFLKERLIQTGASGIHSPIYYGTWANTTYYSKPDGISNFAYGMTYRSKAMLGLPGNGRQGLNYTGGIPGGDPLGEQYYAKRPYITGDSRYWTGAMGWSRVDMNQVAEFGSGFIDSWSNPGNQPSGTSHWVGTQAWHFLGGPGGSKYGWQMVGGPIRGLWFRSSWGGFRSWRKIPLYDDRDNGVGVGALYASRYYGNTDAITYYLEPTGFSNLNTGLRGTNIYARSWFRNDAADTGLLNSATGARILSDSTRGFKIYAVNNGVAARLKLSTAGDISRGYFYAESNNDVGILNGAGQWRVKVFAGDWVDIGGSSLRVNRLYDRNTYPTYFWEGGNGGSSSTIVNQHRANYHWFGNWVGSASPGYAYSPYQPSSGTGNSKLGRIREIAFKWNTTANYDDARYHGIRSTDLNGSFTDSMSLNSYNDIVLRIDSNNNNTNSYVRFMDNSIGSNQFAYIGRQNGVPIAYLGTGDVYGGRFRDANSSSFWANPGGQSQFNTLTLSGNRLGFINTAFDAEINVSDANPDGTGADFAFWGDRVQYNARLITEVFHATRHVRANTIYPTGNNNYYLQPLSSSRVAGSIRTEGNRIYIRGGSPTLTLQDTNHRSSHIHCNSNLHYILRGSAVDSTSWTSTLGYWPAYWNLNNNDAIFGGNLTCRANIIAYASDIRLKENVERIPEALDKLCSLRGITFDWKQEAFDEGFTTQTRYNDVGLVAQEVEKVLPALVMRAPFDTYQPNPDLNGEDEHLWNTSKSGKEYLTVQYDRVVALAVEAIKEQQEIINSQRKELDELKDVVQKLIEKIG